MPEACERIDSPKKTPENAEWSGKEIEGKQELKKVWGQKDGGNEAISSQDRPVADESRTRGSAGNRQDQFLRGSQSSRL